MKMYFSGRIAIGGIVVGAVLVAGCSMTSAESASESELLADAGDDVAGNTAENLGRAPSTSEHARRCEEETPRGDIVWRHDFGMAALLESASVAADGAGNVFHAKAEHGVSKLDGAGNVRWHVPFGEIVAADTHGNAYVGTSARDCADAMLTKLDPHGNVVWSYAVGRGSIQSIAASRDQKVVVSGVFGTVKLDARGRVDWRKPFGGYVALGAGGDVLITGAFEGNIDLGNGPIASRGLADAFIVKLSPSGKHRWSHFIGDADLPIARPGGGSVTEPSDQLGRGISEGPNGDVFVTGFAMHSIKLFGNDFAAPNASEVGILPMAYVARLDRKGGVVWTRLEYGVREVRGLASDSRGNSIVTGGFVSGVRPFIRPWVEKLDPTGSVAWVHTDELGLGIANGVATDHCGNVLVSVTASSSPDAEIRATLLKLRP